MAVSDFQAYLQERLAAFDETMDLSTGSPADIEVVQPLLRRLGTDPFTVDMGVFLQDRLNQEFPDLPTKEGDAITDLLVKMCILLWDPIVRENFRVRQQLSLKDPTILTLEEAEALGANLFAKRNTGNTARGTARIYFAQAQSIGISPANFITSRGGLHFFPTEIQSISVNEMLFNVEGNLYYFDVSVAGENPGDQYNIGVDELVTIANLAPAVRLTNKARFRFGVPAETAVAFIDRAGQDLTERSLVTERGITSKVAAAFAEVTRIGVTGFNDPEMQRDVLTGGGLGRVLGGGISISVIADGENKITSRRLEIDNVNDVFDFTALIGPTGVAVEGYTLTLHDAYSGNLPVVRDLTVLRVISSTVLEVAEQVLLPGASDKPWVLRKNSLTLSGIPGGILFPDTAAGTVDVPDDQVHIGGATDIFVRGTDLDTVSVILDAIVDDDPILSGQTASVTGGYLLLQNLTMGTAYSLNDDTYEDLANSTGLTIQLLDAPIAGTYRILNVLQLPGQNPLVTVTPEPPAAPGLSRWRLLDVLDIDLVEPKETKITGSDLRTVQGLDVVDTAGGADLASYGVGQGDILRILSGGLIEGDYTVVEALSPFFTRVQVDRELPATINGAQYLIFRANADGGVRTPLLRIDSVDLLDTSNQPLGTKVPYAKPIDARSRSFANSAHGVKADVHDTTLGCVSSFFQDGTFDDVDGLTLTVSLGGSSPVTFTVTFTAATSVTDVIDQVNAAVDAETGGSITVLAVPVDTTTAYPGGRRFGFLAVAPNTQVTGGTAVTILFADQGTAPYSSTDIRSATQTNGGGWISLRPALDLDFDVVQVLDGVQTGFYDELVTTDVDPSDPLNTVFDFAPEANRHVQVGSRSFGSARLFFLEPTSIEFDPESTATLTAANGSLLGFFPDPTLSYQRVPALPNGTKPKDGVTTGSDRTFTTAGVSLIQKGIQAGDKLVIDYQPLIGSVALADPVTSLQYTTIFISIDGGSDKQIVFVHDDNSIAASSVTRQGVADQINRIVGQTICRINSGDYLEFEADASIIVRGNGTANALLGFDGSDTSNDAEARGSYIIDSVDSESQVTVINTSFLPLGARQQFKIFRVGLQRICSTQMATQVAETGLYYFDLELISQGTGDQYNIEANAPMVVDGFRSDGYYLTTEDSNLTFSSVERPHMHVSPSILEVGTTDDPDNATQLSGQNIQLNYERSALTANVQNFVMAETERVINQSPLARHLIPYFVRLDLTYFGGSAVSVVRPDVEKLIKGLFPKDSLEVSDLEKILSTRGAKSITNPVNLLAVIHNFDRTVVLERSQDKLNTGRLAAFIPDVLNIVRKVA